LTYAVVCDDAEYKIYLFGLSDNSCTELPEDSFMHYFIDDGHLFYVVSTIQESEADGEVQYTERTYGYCVDLDTGLTREVLSPSEEKATETRFINGSRYALVIYTDIDGEAEVVDLLEGKKQLIRGFSFSEYTTVDTNDSMTQLLFSNANDSYTTEEIAVLDLESGIFRMLKIEGGCERIEMDIRFVSDGKIAVSSYLTDDPDHFYVSLYTFFDFCNTEI